MAPLHRTIAFVEMQDIAVLIAENLDFDMTGAANVALQKYRAVSEGGRGLAARFLQRGVSSSAFSTTRMPRPPPPNAALMISG